MSELQTQKARLEQDAKQNEQQQQELNAEINSLRQAAQSQREALDEIKTQLLAHSEQFRLWELERLSTEETLRLKDEGHQKRLADLDAEIEKANHRTAERSQQEADLRAEMAALA